MKSGLTSVQAGLIAAIMSAVVYTPALFNGFVWDDGYLVRENKTIRSLRNIPYIFTHPWSSGTRYTTGAKQNRAYWRPLAETSFAVDYFLGQGYRAWVFHLDSILWHAFTVFLLVLLFARLGLSPGISLVTGLFFGLHPVHTEAVNLICYRTTLMAGLFGVWSMYVHLGPGDYTWKRGIFVSLLLFLALLAKETAGAFVLILPAMDLVLKRVSKRLVLRAWLPGVLVVIAYGAVHLLVTGPGLYDFFNGMPPITRVLLMVKVFYRYIRLVLFPWPLTPFYDWWILGVPRSVTDPEVISGIILILLVILGLILAAKRNRLLFAGLLIFLFGLVPVSHVVPFFDAMAERFLYIPLMGAALVVVPGLALVFKRMRRFGLVLAILVFLGQAAWTSVRSRQWRSAEVILQTEIEDFSGNVGARLGLVEMYVRRKQYKKAVNVIEPAVRQVPDMQVVWAWLAVAKALSGDYIGARRVLHRAPMARSGEQTAVMLARTILIEVHRLDAARKIGI